MRRHPIYAIFGVLLLGGVGIAEYRGASMDEVTQIHNVPRSIRDNPGSYRSHYAYLPRYIGGK